MHTWKPEPGRTSVPVLLTILINLILSSSAACAGGSGDTSGPGDLRVGVIAVGTAKEVSAQYQHTADDLSRALGGAQVEIVTSTDYYAIVEGLRVKDLDLAFLGSLSYVLGAGRAPLVPLAVGVNAEGQPGYYSYLITNKPQINSPADVRGHTLALAGKLSTSGSLFPGAALAAAGVNPDTDAQTTRGGNHAANILAVSSGQVDAAFVDSVEFESAVAAGRVDPATVRVAWRSERITGSPIVARGDLPADQRERIKAALLSLQGTPEFPLGVEKSQRLVAVTDDVYDPIRKLAAAQGLTIEAFRE